MVYTIRYLGLIICIWICATDLAWNEISWGPAHLLGNGSQDAGAVWSWGENKWKDSYCTIQRANYVVENIDKVEDIDVKLKNM